MYVCVYIICIYIYNVYICIFIYTYDVRNCIKGEYHQHCDDIYGLTQLVPSFADWLRWAKINAQQTFTIIPSTVRTVCYHCSIVGQGLGLVSCVAYILETYIYICHK